MNIAFTIVAKNYLSLALSLGDSLKETNPNTQFLIFLSDELDGLDKIMYRHKIIEAKEIVEHWQEMAFKYDVVEFSTAIKPFCIKYLFGNNYKKVLYFDPDILIYDSLNHIFDTLEKKSIFITPHVINLQKKWNGIIPENHLLLTGIYNLGYIGLKNSNIGNEMVEWWCQRLKNQCYKDRNDGYFYDQKWIDFLPSFYDDNILHIEKSAGYNMAWWNFHERSLFKENGKLVVLNIDTEKKDDLVFFHFSGYNVYDKEMMCRYGQNEKLMFKNFPILKELFEDYANKVIMNGHDKLSKLSYKYNNFDNGYTILKFHRRIYREIIDKRESYQNLDSFQKRLISNLTNLELNLKNSFNINENSYFQLLQNNKLVNNNLDSSIDRLRPDRDSNKFDNKIKLMVFLMRLVKKVLGFEKYMMLMKFMEIYSRESYQLFLIDEVKKGKK